MKLLLLVIMLIIQVIVGNFELNLVKVFAIH